MLTSHANALCRVFSVVMLAACLVLLGAGCFNAALVPAPAQRTVPFGTATTLALGQSVRHADGLQVRLERIEDSRCPQGVVCVWQGELAPTLRLSGGDLATEQDLRLGTVRVAEGTLGSYVIALREATSTTATIVVTRPGPLADSTDDMVRVTSPTRDGLVTSPLTISGEARGQWFFEASFPVKLLDANGTLLVQAPAQAQGEWMTTHFVRFEAVLRFAAPATATGTLVLEKSNPSGLPEHDDARTIPVRFAAAASPTARAAGPGPPRTPSPMQPIARRSGGR